MSRARAFALGQASRRTGTRFNDDDDDDDDDKRARISRETFQSCILFSFYALAFYSLHFHIFTFGSFLPDALMMMTQPKTDFSNLLR